MARSFDHFRSLIHSHGVGASLRNETILAEDERIVLRYVPFEAVNGSARLVIVGITPGPNQLSLAYAEAQRLLRLGTSTNELLNHVKRLAGFGDRTMRPNLVRMLRHFRVREILNIQDEELLWSDRSDLLHATSVIPNAAFTRKGKPFAGSFDEVQKSSILRRSFLEDFVPTIPQLNPAALYIGLGPTPLAALHWCITSKLLRRENVLGAFAHPSTNGGSQVKYFLREIARDQLSERDPVRDRCAWLDRAYTEMRTSIDRWLTTPI